MPGETSPWWRETVVEASLSLNALLSFRAKGGRAARHGSAKTVSDFPGLDRALPGNTGDRSVGRSGGRWIWADMMPAQGEGGGGRGKAGKRGMARRMGREADAHYFPWCLKPIPHQLLHRRLLAHAKGGGGWAAWPVGRAGMYSVLRGGGIGRRDGTGEVQCAQLSMRTPRNSGKRLGIRRTARKMSMVRGTKEGTLLSCVSEQEQEGEKK